MSSDSAIQFFQRPVVGHFDPAWSGSQKRLETASKGLQQAQLETDPNATWHQSGTEVERINFTTASGAEAAEFSFADFVDIVNPLQHIPVVSTFYRDITGDQISGPAKVFGGALFGGPLGFVSSIVDTLVTEVAGRDIGETLLNVAGLSTQPDSAVAERAVRPVAAQTDAEQPASTAESTPSAAATAEAPRVPQAPSSAQVATALAAYGTAAGDAPNRAAPAEAASPHLNHTVTGKAAINAFLTDLRGIAEVATPPAPPAPSPVAETPTAAKGAAQTAANSAAIPLREEDWQGRINQNPPLPPANPVPAARGTVPAAGVLPQAALGEGAFSQQMLMALDKYETMAKARARQAPSEDAGGENLDDLPRD